MVILTTFILFRQNEIGLQGKKHTALFQTYTGQIGLRPPEIISLLKGRPLRKYYGKYKGPWGWVVLVMQTPFKGISKKFQDISPLPWTRKSTQETPICRIWHGDGGYQKDFMYQKAANYIGVTVRKRVFVFLQYNINRSKGVFWAKVLLNLASEGLKYPPEVRVEHKHVVLHAGHLYKSFWTKFFWPGWQGGSGKVKIWPRMHPMQ